MLWHGAHIQGQSSHQNCKDWTTNDTSSVGIASDFLPNYMLHQQTEQCNNTLIVLCIELPPRFVHQYFFTHEIQNVAENPSKTHGSVAQISFEQHKECLNYFYGNGNT